MSLAEVSAEYQMLMEQFISLGDELDAMGEEDEDDQVRFKQILQLKTKRYEKKNSKSTTVPVLLSSSFLVLL